MRLEEMSAGRSINLALSDRGIAALREVGMDEYMLERSRADARSDDSFGQRRDKTSAVFGSRRANISTRFRAAV